MLANLSLGIRTSEIFLFRRAGFARIVPSMYLLLWNWISTAGDRISIRDEIAGATFWHSSMRNPLDARSRVLTGNIRHIIRHELDPRSCYKLIRDTCFSTSLPGFFFLDCLSKRNFQLTAEIRRQRRGRGARRTKFIGCVNFTNEFWQLLATCRQSVFRQCVPKNLSVTSEN